ncbi:MAG: ornithine carbamoyltransferase [Candidatus Brocadiia bacterium]
MKSRHFVNIASTPLEDLLEIFDVTARQKETLAREGRLGPLLEGKTLGMLFEKPSLRTRVSFEVAMAQLGGHTTTLGQGEVQLGQREAVCDFARVLCRYVDVIAARVFQHRHVEEMARNSRVAVINALSDYSHPCQALADLWTFKEHVGRWEGAKLAFVGDGNNVARSLGFLCAKLGVRFALASPPGYGFDDAYLEKLERTVENKKFSLEMGADPRKLLRGADAVYTDVWASMGQEAEREKRKKEFAPYQLNEKLLRSAKPGAIVLHCLPAHRGEEITDGVMDGPQAAVYDQAENRMHTERALLTLLTKK